MSNYIKLKNSAPDKSIYIKSGGAMVFMQLEDMPQMRKVIELLDTKDKEIEQLNKKLETMDTAFRVMEKALRSRGIIL